MRWGFPLSPSEKERAVDIHLTAIFSCRGYSIASRLACFGAKGVQYGLVGLTMGILGSSFVLGLTTIRSSVDKGYKPPPTYQPVLGTGLGWLIFMSGNSNLRYNLINLLEDISYERQVFLSY